MKLSRPFGTAVTLAVLGLAGLARGQNYTLERVRVAAGGGSATGGSYSLVGTIGQAEAGRLNGGGFALQGGFLPAPIAPTLPVAPDLAVATPTNTPLRLSVTKLLAQASSPDGYTLSLLGVSSPSAAGGGVAAGPTTVTYAPPHDFTGIDSFTYTVNDGHGGSATGAIAVTVGTISGGDLNLVFGPVMRNGQFVVRFAGVPGLIYTIEWADTPAGPWTKDRNLPAPERDQGLGVGVFEFSQETAGGSRFFRTVYPAY